jgi:hypothetical protein
LDENPAPFFSPRFIFPTLFPTFTLTTAHGRPGLLGLSTAYPAQANRYLLLALAPDSVCRHPEPPQPQHNHRDEGSNNLKKITLFVDPAVITPSMKGFSFKDRNFEGFFPGKRSHRADRPKAPTVRDGG